MKVLGRRQLKLLPTFFGTEPSQSLPFFAISSQVVRKFAKKTQSSLEAGTNNLRTKMSLNPAPFAVGYRRTTQCSFFLRSWAGFGLPQYYPFTT
jgi:hypothetical protein